MTRCRCKWYSLCPLRRFEEEGKISSIWKRKYCEGRWTDCERYKMEEKGEPHPDNMLPDGTIERGLK
ncbi:MAG: uracil-DNA glycosylase [Candidatus Aenigmatarchaeota archaeon]|nr:MAG: uracil-DNA glycosylase [Candidatus Aenigmarchaeota archaeon]